MISLPAWSTPSLFGMGRIDGSVFFTAPSITASTTRKMMAFFGAIMELAKTPLRPLVLFEDNYRIKLWYSAALKEGLSCSFLILRVYNLNEGLIV